MSAPRVFALKGIFKKALYRVGVKKGEGTHTAGCADHIGNRHDRARFIVYHHDGDENRIRAEGGFQRVDRDKAFLVGLEVRDLEASCFQNFKGWSTAWCSTAVVMICRPRFPSRSQAEKIAQLSASVPPEVKKTRSGSAPRALTTALRADFSSRSASIPRS